jgi:hypothetical protein
MPREGLSKRRYVPERGLPSDKIVAASNYRADVSFSRPRLFPNRFSADALQLLRTSNLRLVGRNTGALSQLLEVKR